MEQKTFLQYWLLAIRRSSRRAWKSIGASGRVISVITAIVASVVLKPPTSLNDLLQVNSVIVGIIIIIIYIVMLIGFFSREPVIIHNEKVGEIEQLQFEKRTLVEQAHPKLEIYYDESDTNSRHVFAPTVSVYRVKVRNMGLEQVRDIAVEIKETHPATYGNFPVELHFMNDVPDLLNPSRAILVDVMEIHLEIDKLWFYGEKEMMHVPIPVQDYEILISASGHNSPMTEKWFRFSVRSSDTGTQLIFKEGNQ